MVRNKHNTPGIIKYPFWSLAARNPNAVYACLNLEEAAAPRALARRAILVQGDIGEALEALREAAAAGGSA